MSEAQNAIRKVAELADNFAAQAGVGGMETAGSLVSYLAKHPEYISALLNETLSVFDLPDRWHTQGCLSWHGANGKIYTPECVRRQMLINDMAKDQPA